MLKTYNNGCGYHLAGFSVRDRQHDLLSRPGRGVLHVHQGAISGEARQPGARQAGERFSKSY